MGHYLAARPGGCPAREFPLLWVLGQEQINDMLASSPVEDAEEYAIHDYEGFTGYSISEYEGIQRAHEVTCFLGKLRISPAI